MTLHYAPQTPEEEELALALALAASLNSGGPASGAPRPGSGSSSSSRLSSSSHFNPASAGPSRGPSSSVLIPAPPVRPPGHAAPSQAQPPTSASIYPAIPSAAPSLAPPTRTLPSAPAAHLRPTPLAVPQHVHAAKPHAHSQPGSPSSSGGSSTFQNPLLRPGGPGAGGIGSGGLSAPSSPKASAHTRPSSGAAAAAAAAAAHAAYLARPTRPPPQPPAPAPQRAPALSAPPPPAPQRAPAPAPPRPPAHVLAPPAHAPAPPARVASPSPSTWAPAPPRQSPPPSKAGSSVSGTSAGAAPGPAARPQPRRQLFTDPSKCAGCGKGFALSLSGSMEALGRKWHTGCMRCGFCDEPINVGGGAFQFAFHPDAPQQPYHPDCYRHSFHPTCDVCGEYVSTTEPGSLSYQYKSNGFWKQPYCTTHTDSELTRCCACYRLKKKGDEWAPLPDGRPLCLHCLCSVTLDTRDAQPVYEDVLAFYRNEMKLPHPQKPPMVLVDAPTLSAHAKDIGRDDTPDAPVFHLRGVCLSQVTRTIPSIVRDAGNTIRSVAAALAPTRASASASAAAGSVHCTIQAILVLYGMPRLLTGSILAHELMHARLRMEGLHHLDLKVEEGLCQLMACLWLDRQHDLLTGQPEEQRLASYFSYSIRTDTSAIYGDGFREAFDAFQQLGLTALLDNVRRYGRYTR